MATKSDKLFPTPPSAEKTRAHDFYLDPLPVPEAIESDSDTAWGLWEHSLQGSEGPAVMADGAYDDTLPGTLDLNSVPTVQAPLRAAAPEPRAQERNKRSDDEDDDNTDGGFAALGPLLP